MANFGDVKSDELKDYYYTPAGVIYPYAGVNVPTGFIFCDGSSYGTATYPNLFLALGYAYGGSGANFNVPDLRGRVGAGKDNMGGTSANRLTSAGAGISGTALNATGGTQSQSLSNSQVPDHTHTATSSTTGIAVSRATTGLSLNGAYTGATIQTALTGITVSNAATGIGVNGAYTGIGLGVQNTNTISGLNGVKQTQAVIDSADAIRDPGHTHSVTDPQHVHALSDPRHTHTLSDPAHTHTLVEPSSGAGHLHSITDSGHTHTVSTGGASSTGGATPTHPNVQPTIIINYIIKY
jgi:microcystin-dependent protein